MPSGSFYDNIHLRTDNRPQLEQAWQSYWEGRGESWAWISPVYAGWISVFDWRCDQQDADTLTDLAAYLSRHAECVAVAFQVQNSELAEYWLFNAGDEVDHYTSDSDYFAAYAQRTELAEHEEVYDGYGPDISPGYEMEEDRTDGGNADLMKSLTGSATTSMEIEAILRTPAYIADDILTALASVVNINNSWASLGYRYLFTEGDTVLGFGQFHHLPPGEPPQVVPPAER